MRAVRAVRGAEATGATGAGPVHSVCVPYKYKLDKLRKFQLAKFNYLSLHLLSVFLSFLELMQVNTFILVSVLISCKTAVFSESCPRHSGLRPTPLI